MTRENEGIRVQLELQYQYEYEKMMDASLMDQVQKILETYDVGKWNEFRGNDSMVLDGSSFSFHVTFTEEHPFLHLEIMHFQRIRERSFPS